MVGSAAGNDFAGRWLFLEPVGGVLPQPLALLLAAFFLLELWAVAAGLAGVSRTCPAPGVAVPVTGLGASTVIPSYLGAIFGRD